MEFNEKLQILRKKKNWTQEQLAEELYISRTAISKWESGKGYPNIESLKNISKLFEVSIDDLLSNDELIIIAEEEIKSNTNRLHNIVYGIVDLLSITFIFLPFYGQQIDDYIQAVNLLAYDSINPIIHIMIFTLLAMMSIVGIAELVLLNSEENKIRILNTVSLVLHVVAILFFALSRQPYATAFLFIFLIIKGVLILSENRIK